MATITSGSTEVAQLKARITELEAALTGFEDTRRQLREDHSFREAIIEKAAEGVCVCHAVPEFPHVRFTVWNARMAALTGYSLEDINAKGWYQTMYPDEEIQKAARERMNRMRAGDDLAYERWEIIRADGEKRTIGISTSVLTTDDGDSHVLALMHDVTAEQQHRRFLEARLRDLESLLPICSWCKDIRDPEGEWHSMEEYVTQQFATSFTHGICPGCRDRFKHDTDS